MLPLVESSLGSGKLLVLITESPSRSGEMKLPQFSLSQNEKTLIVEGKAL